MARVRYTAGIEKGGGGMRLSACMLPLSSQRVACP